MAVTGKELFGLCSKRQQIGRQGGPLIRASAPNMRPPVMVRYPGTGRSQPARRVPPVVVLRALRVDGDRPAGRERAAAGPPRLRVCVAARPLVGQCLLAKGSWQPAARRWRAAAGGGGWWRPAGVQWHGGDAASCLGPPFACGLRGERLSPSSARPRRCGQWLRLAQAPNGSCIAPPRRARGGGGEGRVALDEKNAAARRPLNSQHTHSPDMGPCSVRVRAQGPLL